MMEKINQLNEFSDVVACAWLLDMSTWLCVLFSPYAPRQNMLVFFGSPDLSDALIHTQWLVICYVV
jgi:hypothetical protein